MPFFTALTLLSLSTLPARAADTADLRSYGRVSASFTPNSATFTCENAGKADILLGKLLADLFWDAGGEAKTRDLVVDGATVQVHEWTPYGLLVVGEAGAKVIAVGGADEAALRTQLRLFPDLLRGHPRFAPAKPYPRYLDHYDLRAYKAYTAAMSSKNGQALDSHWPFLKKFGLGGIAFQSLSPVHSPASGVVSFVQSDYEMNTADQNGGVASVGLSCGGHVPLWIYNEMPEAMMQPSPTTLLSAWQGTGPDGAHYESWWLTAEQRASGSLLFMRQAMERYRNNPALSAWHLYTGSPGAELSFHDRYGQFWDYSPVGEAAFRTWLRDVRKDDLRSLGQRWYGDPKRFTSWDQVQVPDANGFFGALDETCLRLTDGWQFASAQVGLQDPPPVGDPAWIPVAMPPSQQQVLLPWGEAFYRVAFEAADWAARPSAYVSVNALARSAHPTVVWLNGEKLGEEATSATPIAFPVAGRLKPGRNVLTIRVPRGGAENAEETNVREGKILGPVFLTTTKPVNFPYLGEQANARYVDLKEWQAAGVANAHRIMLDLAQALDPDHPFNLSGSAQELTDQMTDLAEEYGGSLQHTGREAWYHPWWAGVGLLGGFYGTSEESATANTVSLTRELGRMILDGDSSHNLFYNIDDYQVEEQKSGWFTQHQRAIQCFGKYLRAMPKIAVFRSARSMRLGSREPWNWDLGTGELQAAHIDNVYATETELLKGMTDACPVLLDGGTDIMDADVVEALRRYIERGGTYIAFQQTGRHTSSRQDAQPLSRLTGMLTVAHLAGTVRIGAGEGTPVLKAWAGRAFPAAASFGLTPAPDGVAVPGESPVTIATWSDGAVAISERRIGKGRILQIAAPFWRDGIVGDNGHIKNAQSAIELPFLKQLMADLGIAPNADASTDRIWTRKATTKNGLQDWLLTYNNSDTETAADVHLAVDQQPAEVWDALTRKPVPFTYNGGFVTIRDVHYPPWETRIFAMKHADLAGGLPVWWREKTVYWKRPPAAHSAAVAAAAKWLAAMPLNSTNAGAKTVAFSHWRFLADRAGAVAGATAWSQPGFDDRAWQVIESGPWNLQDSKLADWHGTSLYRAPFAIPASWKGRKVLFNLYDYDLPIVYDHGDFFINGTKVAEYTAHGWSQAYAYDVTPLLRESGNVLSVRVQGGKQFSGLSGNIWLEPEAQFASEIDLGGAWQVVKADFKSTVPATLPGSPTGRYLERDIDLPDNWMGKPVFVHLETGTQWVGSIVVNGHLINTNGSLHPFSPRCEVNLSPYLRRGRNRIELWPFSTITSWFAPRGKVDEMPLPIIAIRLGVVEKAQSATAQR